MVMQSETVEPDREGLPYGMPAPRAASKSARTLGASSLLCIAVPIVGFAIRNSPMFLAGFPLSFIGAALGFRALASSTNASSVSALAIIGTVGNSLIAAYFVWLFMVRGMC